MFQLKPNEFKILKSQFVMSSWGGRRTRPYVFTEQGAAMLSSVLKSKQAIEVNILIMRAFVKLREIISSNKELAEKIEKLEKKYNKQFSKIFMAIQQLMAPFKDNEKRQIGFVDIESGQGEKTVPVKPGDHDG